MAAKLEADRRVGTLGKVLSWVFGGLLLLASLALLTDGAIATSLFLAIAGLLLIAPAQDVMRDRLRVHLSIGWRIVIVLVLVLIASLSTPSHESSSSETPPHQTAQVRNASEATANVKSVPLANITYRSIRFDDLMRYSERYRDTYVSYKGEVVQVLGPADGQFELRVAITPDAFLWRDPVLVDYMGARVLEGDLVNVSGRYAGLETYDAVGGGAVTVPKIVDANVTVLVKAGDRR